MPLLTTTSANWRLFGLRKSCSINRPLANVSAAPARTGWDRSTVPASAVRRGRRVGGLGNGERDASFSPRLHPLRNTGTDHRQRRLWTWLAMAQLGLMPSRRPGYVQALAYLRHQRRGHAEPLGNAQHGLAPYQLVQLLTRYSFAPIPHRHHRPPYVQACIRPARLGPTRLRSFGGTCSMTRRRAQDRHSARNSRRYLT